MANDTAKPSTRIIVALDGSQLAETSLPLVRTLAMAMPAEVTLLHVLEREAPATVHGEPHLTTKSEAENYLRMLAGQIQDVSLKVATHVHDDAVSDVAGGIAGHAAELEADMIVLAAHGRGGIREWLVGRIPQQVVARAGRPTLIVPAPTQRDLSVVRRIMLPVDPAGEAEAAIPVSMHLADGCSAELLMITVIPTATTMSGNSGVVGIFMPRASASVLNLAEDEARTKLAQMAQKVAQAGLAATVEVRRGDPAHELLRAIDERLADLVVMATHARAGLDGLLEGSVTPRVVASASCPLLLIPIQS